MNNVSLDDLVKRDKKLGRVAGTKGKKPNPSGKRPNKMQQQRNLVNNAKQQKGGQQQNQQRPQQKGPGRIKNKGAGIFKKQGNQARQQPGKVIKTAQGGQGRVMAKKNQNNRQQKGNNQGASRNEIAQSRRQRLLQKAKGKAQNNNKNQPQGKKQKMQPVVKYTPSKPLPKKQPVVPVGTLAQRKLKVRNIDANNVTVADLHKLFGNCGNLINAGFDRNMAGQYLGSATLIYVKANSAAEAIKSYNNAQLDDRVMKVEYALPQNSPVAKAQPASGKNNKQKLSVVKKPLSARRGNNAIQKRDGSAQKSEGGKQKGRQATANGQKPGARRGLGQKRRGKTLSLAPASSSKRRQQQKSNQRSRR